MNPELLKFSRIRVRLGKDELYEFDAEDSLDFNKRDLKILVEEHTQEYYLWRTLRDKVRRKLRKLKILYESAYDTKFYNASIFHESSNYTVSKQLIHGFMENDDDLKKSRDRIAKLEGELDKLDTIIYVLEHRKQMLWLFLNSF